MNKKTKEFREQISAEFLKTLEEAKASGKSLNWQEPWFNGLKPRNGQYNRPYKGINQVFLRFVTNKNNYDDPRWYTFNQIKKMGCHLQKETKGTLVEYWYPWDITDGKKLKWSEVKEAEEKNHKLTLYAYYNTVFNGSCITGLSKYEPETAIEPVEPDMLIEKVSKALDVEIIEDEMDRAYYSSVFDKIHLPKQKYFKSSADYNATALHELTHSTGHEKRLNRELKNFFGSEEYAFEELVAEIGCAMTSQFLKEGLGQTQFENSAAYLDSWIKAVKENADVFPKAVKLAEQASDYMLESAQIIKKGENNETSQIV